MGVLYAVVIKLSRQQITTLLQENKSLKMQWKRNNMNAFKILSKQMQKQPKDNLNYGYLKILKQWNTNQKKVKKDLIQMF